MTASTLAPADKPAPVDIPGVVFAHERIQDGPLVEALIDRAFGPGRYVKSAERLREGNVPRLDLSVCAWEGDRLVGAARQWPILVGDTPAVFLGPFAVEEAFRSRGLGGALIRRACALAEGSGAPLTVLVGDMAYFAPFGFTPAPPDRVSLPGPVDPGRLLWRADRPGALDGAAGPIRIPPEA